MKECWRCVTCLALVISATVLPISLAYASSDAPHAQMGVLDLSGWDFTKRGSVLLAGDWEFFPSQLVEGNDTAPLQGGSFRSVPDRWGSAIQYGSYRLTLILPQNLRDPALRIPTIATSYELDADGQTLAFGGHPSAEASTYTAAYKTGVVELHPASNKVVLVLRVANYTYRTGGMWRCITLGDRSVLARSRWMMVMGSFSLAAALITLALFFSFFIRTENSGHGFIWFSIFAAASALRAMVTGEYAITYLFPGIPFDLVIRLEYLSVYLLFPFGLAFLTVMFPDEAKVGVFRVLSAACAVFLLLLFTPLPILTRSIIPYYLVAACIVLYSAVILIRALLKKRPGSFALALGGGAAIAAAVNDILFSSFIIYTGDYFPLGILCFILSQAYVLSSRYMLLQNQLRSSIAEKDMLIKEVHHRVKNSFQIMSSVISLQAHKSTDPNMLLAYESIRNRIRAISLAHEKLYFLDSGDEIDVSSYCHDLAAQFSGSYSAPGGGITLDVESIHLPSDFCIDIGLVITELVTNAYKYASGPKGLPNIRIHISRDSDTLLLLVQDDGPGFPPEVAVGNASTLGFRLVATIAKKRQASIELSSVEGASIALYFPLSIIKPKEVNA